MPYPCGAFGWLSYDVARELEDLPDTTEDDRGLPRMQFGVYDRVAAWREPRGDGPTELRITCCPRVAPDDDSDGEPSDDSGAGGASVAGSPSRARRARSRARSTARS